MLASHDSSIVFNACFCHEYFFAASYLLGSAIQNVLFTSVGHENKFKNFIIYFYIVYSVPYDILKLWQPQQMYSSTVCVFF